MANARLTALRLVGFKSFAEKTVVEFGSGISAVVGPNGSGKSNLADALRWTLGEQGRTLRTRRSEDVIFAGSSSRRAIGMADVTLVIDNSDHLLPVDFGEVEIGRRLYRSGESEYLLNRQRIRLRDLVELLDAGNLADNAFLFIGQGMVDQALALRPEERRPLFEEAAGVRRHERRRRHAEAELVEAEANLDRLRDILAELRPQQKRLAAQAEQLQARRTAGVELAEGLLAAARQRWVTSSRSAAQQQMDVDRARAAADTALTALKGAEEESAALSLAIGKRADTERAQRDALDRQRAELTELRVGAARLESESAAVTRDGERTSAERAAVEKRLAEASRLLSIASAPQRAMGPEDELALIERQLERLEPSATTVDAGRELRARRAELDQQSRRRDSVSVALDGAKARLTELESRLSKAQAERDEAGRAAAGADEQGRKAEASLAAARLGVDHAASERSAAHERLVQTESELAGVRARAAALDALQDGADEGLARAARARGATLLGEGLEVDPRLRRAVSAALGAAASAYLVTEEAVPALAGRRGTLAVSIARPKATAAAEAAIGAARESGGGALIDAIRRDPQSEVSRLVGRVVWTPDLDSALKLRSALPPGWRVVTLAGEVIADDGIVSLASGDSVLDRRAEQEAVARDAGELEGRLDVARAALDKARTDAESAAVAARDATAANDAARQERRRTEEHERVAQRRAEQLLRERDWERAQVERLIADVAAAESLVDQLRADVERLEQAAGAQLSSVTRAATDGTRRQELRSQRDELRRQHERQLGEARASDDARRTMEIRRAIDETRLVELDAQIVAIGARSLDLGRQRDGLAARVAQTEASVAVAGAVLDELLGAGANERTRLVAAERSAVDAREKLRQAEGASRQAEMAAMEARLQVEQTREQLLVELATIGADGLLVLRTSAGLAQTDAHDEESAAQTMEELLDLVVALWSNAPSSDDVAPSQGKLAALRRRFNELGAGNPFAVQEYAELRERLESLDAQRADMETAIDNTRELIASLSALINEQFRTTFAALEGAFERRFHELFGGGDAQLSLTMPDDISATGIEIHARPPGKKRQPLSMLSGGERALTAVSLLLAMLEVRPVPFCVLDEVDAALDEANVGRFSKALRGLAEQTQFIVITHNRGTIEAADALYGVTLGDDAVSRVVSLRLPGTATNGHGPEIDEQLAEAALA